MREDKKRKHSPEMVSHRRSRDKFKREASPGDHIKHAKRNDIKPGLVIPSLKAELAIKQQQETTQTKMIDETELRQKEAIYKAKMEIEERKNRLNLASGNTTLTMKKSDIVLKPEEASAFAMLQMKQKRLDELKRNLSARSPATNAAAATAAPAMSAFAAATAKKKIKPEEHQPLFDDDLRLDDSASVATDIASAEATASSVAPLDVRSGAADAASGLVEYLDPRVHLKPATRQTRRGTFNFKARGEYERLADAQRKKAKLEKLQAEIARAAKQTGISSAVKLAIVTPSSADLALDAHHVPEIEWWDEIVLGGSGKTYSDLPSLDLSPEERYKDTITSLVEHPIQLKPPDEPAQHKYLKACLTAKERRKLRRQNRRELLKEKMEKVRLGLEPPPEPKLKISNLMRVLGNDAVQDPTKMEAHVRKQIADRLKKHERDNMERKLTREQRAEKMSRKIAEDTALAVHVAVYKVKALANPSKRFKVQKNAEQLQMTGIFLTLEDVSLIVVEGGPKQQKFYENLMMRRIKWSDEIAGQKREINQSKSETSEGERNECTLIWKGIVQRRAFGEPKFIAANSHKHAREIMDKHGVAHYWDLCYSTMVLLTSDD